MPSAEALVNMPADGSGLPAEVGETVGPPMRASASGAVRLDGGEQLEEFAGSLVTAPGVGPAAVRHMALRPVARDAFPGAGEPLRLRARFGEGNLWTPGLFSMLTLTALAVRIPATIAPTSSEGAPYPALMSAVTGADTVAAM